MSNQPRPFSWFRLAPFGRQMQPSPALAPALTPRAPTPQPFRPSPPPLPRPTTRPLATSPPPPPAPPQTRALFRGVTPTTPTPTAPPPPATATATVISRPALRPPTTSTTTITSPASPTKSMPATSLPSSPGILPVTSSFKLTSPETKTTAPSTSLPTPLVPKPTVESPPKSRASPPAPVVVGRGPTTSTTTIIKPLKESPPKHIETKPLSRPPPLVAHEKLPRRIVTLIGENRGAIMVLKPSTMKSNYKKDGESGSERKNKENHHMNTMDMESSTLFVNNNVQGVNNSILLDDSSLTDHDPGFHLFFSAD